MSLEQVLPPPPAAPRAPMHDQRRTHGLGLSAEELAALREVWSTPLRPEPPLTQPALLH